jgi:hypothetical protein
MSSHSVEHQASNNSSDEAGSSSLKAISTSNAAISSVDLGKIRAHGFVSEDGFESKESLVDLRPPVQSPVQAGSQTPFFSVHMERQFEQVNQLILRFMLYFKYLNCISHHISDITYYYHISHICHISHLYK